MSELALLSAIGYTVTEAPGMPTSIRNHEGLRVQQGAIPRLELYAGRLSNLALLAGPIDEMDKAAEPAPFRAGSRRQFDHMVEQGGSLSDTLRVYVALRRQQREGLESAMRRTLAMLIAAETGEISIGDVTNTLFGWGEQPDFPLRAAA